MWNFDQTNVLLLTRTAVIDRAVDCCWLERKREIRFRPPVEKLCCHSGFRSFFFNWLAFVVDQTRRAIVGQLSWLPLNSHRIKRFGSMTKRNWTMIQLYFTVTQLQTITCSTCTPIVTISVRQPPPVFLARSLFSRLVAAPHLCRAWLVLTVSYLSCYPLLCYYSYITRYPIIARRQGSDRISWPRSYFQPDCDLRTAW